MQRIRNETDDPRALAREVATATGESPSWIYRRGFGLLIPPTVNANESTDHDDLTSDTQFEERVRVDET